jgi:hypothetical protein
MREALCRVVWWCGLTVLPWSSALLLGADPVSVRPRLFVTALSGAALGALPGGARSHVRAVQGRVRPRSVWLALCPCCGYEHRRAWQPAADERSHCRWCGPRQGPLTWDQAL